MAADVIMPKLGMGMKEGTVVEWKKAAGDEVNKGDVVVVISSEKIEMEVEAPVDGVLLEIAVEAGEVVPIGTAIGHIGHSGEQVVKAATPTASSAPQQLSEQETEEQTSNVSESSSSMPILRKAGVKISPVARKIAVAAGLNIEGLAGTGPGGRITKEDVEKAIQEGKNGEVATAQQVVSLEAHHEDATQLVPMTGMRKIIAERMHESLRNSAQLTMTMRVDVTDLLALKKQAANQVENSREAGDRLTVTDFIARAVVRALQEHVQMNSTYTRHGIETYSHVHLGIAVALENGLVVPVIRHAERMSVLELSRTIRNLSQRARKNQLNPEEMSGSTFTITNLGAYHIETFTPILNPPETGILGVGVAHDMPVYVGDLLHRRSLLPLSLTFDHQVLDGAPAAAFLHTIKEYLEHPYRMLL
ncbi:dihydrolipoamide acetyltransferase family protein [Aneurinibacillus aneurinilyticus]|jgi:pyruvate dehydrogenase E2 component (dihydrolipoamide acetyltransferase)|uniref:dihydrolipoamide acetyltransferase family protein n=1 Tax=Aneurinibacillus aneurinilyticus TaxID=1391 RepID=UPI0023F2F005|nr:dihydrolipoamide acetyltransferase family protein [Aneurinibacillus aneurinilyticus]MCI1695501.1 2-oxo acid dehydrogenase subunit E2 [Aneurinibacillus aneurinilyticus]